MVLVLHHNAPCIAHPCNKVSQTMFKHILYKSKLLNGGRGTLLGKATHSIYRVEDILVRKQKPIFVFGYWVFIFMRGNYSGMIL